MHPARYTRRDFLFAVLTGLVVLVLSVGILSADLSRWGDDFAGYLNQAFSIADHRQEEQYRLNAVMHPTTLPEEVQDGQLVYAWGFPLLEAGVYKLTGFDRTEYTSVVYYKLILLFSTAACGAALMLFLRRRFSLRLSVFLSVIFCLNPMLLNEINSLYGDIVFLLFTVLTFLLAECFAFSEKKHTRLITGLFYALSMWFTYELRLNGFTVLLIALFGHVICLAGKRVPVSGRKLIRHVLPYALCAALVFLFERFLLPAATSNMSDLKQMSWDSLIYNARVMLERSYEFFDSILGFRLYAPGALILIAAVAGLIRNGFRDNLYLSALWIGTVVTLLILPYDQGLRYLLNVLPVMLMFSVYGFRWIGERLKETGKLPGWLLHPRIARGLACLVLCVYALTGIKNGISILSGLPDEGMAGVYSKDAREMYRYIQDNTAEEATIGFAKPRALYLNTGRVSFRPDRNGHSLDEMDYYLVAKRIDFMVEHEDETLRHTCVFENDEFALYDLKTDISVTLLPGGLPSS